MYYSKPKNRRIRYDRVLLVLGLLVLIPVLLMFGLNWINKLNEKNYINSITVMQQNKYDQYENDFKLEQNKGYFLQLNRPKTTSDVINNYYDNFISDINQIAGGMNLDPNVNVQNYRVITVNYDIVPLGNNYDFIVLSAKTSNDKLRAKSQLYDKVNNKFLDGRSLFFDNIVDLNTEFSKVVNEKNKAYIEEFKTKINDAVANVAYNDQKVIFYLNSSNTNTYEDVTLNRNVVESMLKYTLENNELKTKTPPKPKPVAKQVSEKLIALTLDDGPGRYEDDFIALFNKYNIKATFFYIGQNIDANPGVVKRVFDAGHEIGNHTYTHPDLRKISTAKMDEEVSKTTQAILKATGKEPTFIRPPYGGVNNAVRQHLNMPIIYWNVDSEDWKLRPDTNKIVDKVMREVHDGAILLFHSLYKSSYDAIETIIPRLQQQGYRFVTVTELHALCGQTLQPHTIYYGYDF